MEYEADSSSHGNGRCEMEVDDLRKRTFIVSASDARDDLSLTYEYLDSDCSDDCYRLQTNKAAVLDMRGTINE